MSDRSRKSDSPPPTESDTKRIKTSTELNESDEEMDKVCFLSQSVNLNEEEVESNTTTEASDNNNNNNNNVVPQPTLVTDSTSVIIPSLNFTTRQLVEHVRAKIKKTAIPFRIKMNCNKTSKFVTLTSHNLSDLKIQAMRKFPGSIKSNDDTLQVQMFVTQNDQKIEIKDNTDVSKLGEDDVIDVTVTTGFSLSSVNFPTNKVRWFWWDDDARWKPYGTNESNIIEKAYLEGTKDSVHICGGLYTITFSTRTQYRPSTRKSRKIVRGMWFWVSDNNALVPYDESISVKLEMAYLQVQQDSNEESSKSVIIDTSRYVTVKKKSSRQFNNTGNATGRRVQRGSV